MSRKFPRPRSALCIGVPSCSSAKIQAYGADVDANNLAEALRRDGEFELFRGGVHLSVAGNEMVDLVKDFLLVGEEGRELVLTFSGHAVPDEDHGVLLLGNDGEPLGGKDLREWMEKSTARHILLALDCCHSGAALTNDAIRKAVRLTSAPGRWRKVFTACRGDQKAYGSGKKGGNLSRIFFDALYNSSTDDEGYVTYLMFRERLNYEFEALPAWIGKEQNPQGEDGFEVGPPFKLIWRGLGNDGYKRTIDATRHTAEGYGPRGVRGEEIVFMPTSDSELSERPHPADLLRAGAQIIPFMGRKELLEQMDATVEADAESKLMLVCGEGGVGKTRLVLELLNRCLKKGHTAGFVSHEAKGEDLKYLICEAGPPLTIAFDYAERRERQVNDAIRALASAKRKVRICLVARSKGDWWGKLEKHTEIQVKQLALGAWQRNLMPDPTLDRGLFFRKAAEEFAKRLSLPMPDLEWTPDLNQKHFGLPLFLAMAALAAASNEKVESADELLAATLNRERSYWWGLIEQAVPGEKSRYVEQRNDLFSDLQRTVGLITLWGGVKGEDELDRAARKCSQHQDKSMPQGAVSWLLRPFYGRPSEDGFRISGLEPDLLGEELVSQLLNEDDSLLSLALDDEGKENQGHTLTVLNRLAARKPSERRWLEVAIQDRLEVLWAAALEAAQESWGPVDKVVAKALAGSTDKAVSEEIMDQCGSGPNSLLHTAAVSTQIVLWRRLKDWANPTQSQKNEIAKLYDRLGSKLGELGRYDEALEANLEAAVRYRELGGMVLGPRMFDFARALSNLGNRLWELKKAKHGLEISKWAVDIYREIEAAAPDVHLPELPAALNSLSSNLSLLGRNQEAFETAKEAVERRRSEVGAGPDSLLATLINNLGCAFSSLGRHDDALVATKEAVEILRELAKTNSGIYLPNLAHYLNNLGSSLSSLGRHHEAVQATAEAVEKYRGPATANPEAYLPKLAGSLVDLGWDLASVGRYQEAFDATVEAVDIYRELFGAVPFYKISELAISLTTLGVRLIDLERYQEALEATKEAMEIFTEMGRDELGPCVAGLAMATKNMGIAMLRVGHSEEALGYALRALEYYSDLEAARPGAFLREQADSIKSLCEVLTAVGRHQEAISICQDAVTNLWPYFRDAPETYCDPMKLILGGYVESGGLKGGQCEKALIAEIRAVLDSLEK